jgi:hypothetical protein
MFKYHHNVAYKCKIKGFFVIKKTFYLLNFLFYKFYSENPIVS